VVLGLIPATVGISITIFLAAGAVVSEALTPLAGIVAAIFGSIIVVAGGFPFLALLVLFVVASALATRYGFERKNAAHVQEGRHGERGISNVVSHIVVPLALVLVPVASPGIVSLPVLAYLYTSALAFGASDTFASEFGVLTGHARSILSGRSVPPGTNGGVSAAGQAWALVGALTTSLVGAGLFFIFGVPLLSAILTLGGVTLAGFLGCQLDSALGEMFENRGWLTKGSTNFVAMVLTTLIAAAFYLTLR
jgi:uncharacterized protein (TIGR00297 family)